MAQAIAQIAHGVSDYKTVVLYEKFCVICGEPGHTEDTCSTHKITICKYWKFKKCLNPACPYAHGPWELRRPNKPKCVKVFEFAPNTYVVRGCGDRNTHTYESCPKQGLLWPPPPQEVAATTDSKK